MKSTNRKRQDKLHINQKREDMSRHCKIEAIRTLRTKVYEESSEDFKGILKKGKIKL